MKTYIITYTDNHTEDVVANGMTWGFGNVRFWAGKNEAEGKLVKAFTLMHNDIKTVTVATVEEQIDSYFGLR